MDSVPSPATTMKRRGRRPKNEDQEIKKEARKANFLKKIFNGDQATKNSSFFKRKPTLKKKAMELQTLCYPPDGKTNVCLICFDPDGNVDFWPENESEVKKMCSFYMGLKGKEKKELNCCDFLQEKKSKILKHQQKKKQVKGTDEIKSSVDFVISGLSNRVEGLSRDELRCFVDDLESKIKIFKNRIQFLQQQEVTIKKTGSDDDDIDDEKDLFSNLPSIQNLDDNYFQDDHQQAEFDQNNNEMLMSDEDCSNWMMTMMNNQDPDCCFLEDNQMQMINYEMVDQLTETSMFINGLINSTNDHNKPLCYYDDMPISECPDLSCSSNYFS